ncbi:helix-turn-helix transcriptional regulator [Nocardioides gansuensis]|uniref:Helix-turn-helix transcriptional regulator n=1 Tax=Nocardioides gansuensis TaxID=2138300 RepID=A0A2T8FF42_9ACTN|nr:LuxR C-terminal-related transcriptional regulator [Nocardioides gansuensis]PVG84342.1 helix-turn-helix transcriptional regulator [Nocardioides gansuensis]
MTSDPVASAREAFARHDWRAARDGLARSRLTLTTSELELLSEACWWLGDVPEATAVSEEVYERLAAGGEPLRAADRALRVGMLWATRGDITLATAWLKRADGLLATQPPSVVHGYAIYLAASSDLAVSGLGDEAEQAAGHLLGLAGRLGDRSLLVFAQTLRGMAAVLRGELRGFDDLDQAMLPVISGHVDAMWGGDIYCTVIHLCEELGDLPRMRAWTDALAHWARPLSETFVYAGVTRLHQLQLLRAEGDWDTVETELGGLSEGLVGAHGWLAGAGFYELGEVHRLRGRPDEARRCYVRARSLGIEPQPGEAQLLHAGGRSGEAMEALRIALAGETPLRRARLLTATVAIALAAGERDWACQLATELAATAAHFGTPGLRADADTTRARVLLAQERAADAVPLLQRAAQSYRVQRHQHAGALVHELLAQALRSLGQELAAEASLATARAIHARLGATAELDRLAAASRPGGLTSREIDVLVEVARGGTNRDVATALAISDKTVSRHLESVYTKLGVSTRTAAAAWAREHGLV